MLKIVKKPVEPKEAEKSADPTEAKTSKTTVKEVSNQELVSMPPMCVVTHEVGYSHKLPNEDWIKVSFTIAIPTEHKDIDKVSKYAKEWTEEKLNAAVAEITNGE